MAKKTRKMTKRKKVIFAFIVVIIAVLLFSVVGVGVLYLGGGQQTAPNYDSSILDDITVIPSVEDNTIEIEAVPLDSVEGEADDSAQEEALEDTTE